MALKGNKKASANKNLLTSFKHAFEGLFVGIKNVKNMKIHLTFTFLVIIGGFFFKVSTVEWLILLLFIALVISFELMNTALEEAVNLAMPNIHPVAKIAKDVAASSVLVSAIFALISGFIIFLPKVLEFIGRI